MKALYLVWRRVLQLSAEGVFVEADFGRLAGLVVDGQDVDLSFYENFHGLEIVV